MVGHDQLLGYMGGLLKSEASFPIVTCLGQTCFHAPGGLSAMRHQYKSLKNWILHMKMQMGQGRRKGCAIQVCVCQALSGSRPSKDPCCVCVSGWLALARVPWISTVKSKKRREGIKSLIHYLILNQFVLLNALVHPMLFIPSSTLSSPDCC